LKEREAKLQKKFLIEGIRRKIKGIGKENNLSVYSHYDEAGYIGVHGLANRDKNLLGCQS